MDRINITKLGEPLPKLGQEIPEDPEQMKRRKKGGKIDWRTDYVYTMAFWSAYIDWLDWQLDMPGIRPLTFTRLSGYQPIELTFFTTPSDSERKDSKPKRNIILAIEVSHVIKTGLGREAMKWKENNAASSAISMRKHRSETTQATTVEYYSESDSSSSTSDEDITDRSIVPKQEQSSQAKLDESESKKAKKPTRFYRRSSSSISSVGSVKSRLHTFNRL